MNAPTPPTPENFAESLTAGDGDYDEGNCWWLSLVADGNAVQIGITPHDEDGVKLPKVRFRAVVVEGDQTPIVLDRATFERRINARFDNAIKMLARSAPGVWPAHFAALREQILNLDFDLERHDDADQAETQGGEPRSETMSAQRLAEIRRSVAEVADYVGAGLLRDRREYRDRADLLAEVDRLHTDIVGITAAPTAVPVDLRAEATAEDGAR